MKRRTEKAEAWNLPTGRRPSLCFFVHVGAESVPPPAGEDQTVDKVGFLSSRTSDRCHWCGDPHPKSLKNTAFLKKNGLPRQCEHWLAMTCFGFVDSLFLPQRGRMSAKLTGEGEGRKSGNVGRNDARQTFSLITLQCTHWRELPPLGEAQSSRSAQRAASADAHAEIIVVAGAVLGQLVQTAHLQFPGDVLQGLEVRRAADGDVPARSGVKD